MLQGARASLTIPISSRAPVERIIIAAKSPAIAALPRRAGGEPLYRPRCHFIQGDRVRNATRSPIGHYRVPLYLRGKSAPSKRSSSRPASTILTPRSWRGIWTPSRRGGLSTLRVTGATKTLRAAPRSARQGCQAE